MRRDANELGAIFENRLETPELQAHNILKKIEKKPWNLKFHGFCGGLEGIRTLDLSDANRTLSQLSYEPVFV